MENLNTVGLGFSNTTKSQEGIVTLLSVLGSSLSLVGLVFSFITYSLFSDWRNLSGTTLMNLLASLFMTQLLYVIGIGGVQDKELCIGLIFSTQYIRMTVWVWLLIMTRNTYQNFSLSLKLLSPVDPKIKRTFWKSSIVGWFSPGLLLGFAIHFEYPNSKGFDDFLTLQKTNCFILTGYAFMFAFLVPTLLIFSAVLCYLWKIFTVINKNVGHQHSKKAQEKVHKRRMLQLSLYIRITTIVSFVSFSSIIYELTLKHVFWYIFNILQGLQGIFIAICVTCNCQILKIYTMPLRNMRQERESFERIINSDTSISTSLQILSSDPTPDIV